MFDHPNLCSSPHYTWSPQALIKNPQTKTNIHYNKCYSADLIWLMLPSSPRFISNRNLIRIPTNFVGHELCWSAGSDCKMMWPITSSVSGWMRAWRPNYPSRVLCRVESRMPCTIFGFHRTSIIQLHVCGEWASNMFCQHISQESQWLPVHLGIQLW